MVKINTMEQDSGFSLIEVLVATLLFSISILGLISYQSTLTEIIKRQQTQLNTERIAFQLLDSYPYIADNILANGWQYHIKKKSYSDRCQIVVITIISPIGEQAQQQRWFCD